MPPSQSHFFKTFKKSIFRIELVIKVMESTVFITRKTINAKDIEKWAK